MRKVFCCLALLLSAALPLAAQSDRRAGGGRSAWFACIDIPEGLENPAKVMGGNQLTELELPRFMASEPVAIPADGILRIVRESPDAGNLDKPQYIILAEAKIPEGVREALVILAPIPKPEGDLIFRSKVQDLANFKGGDRLYINLSTSNIRVRLGDTRVNVAPGQTNIYESPKLAKPANVPIMYEFYHPERKEWKILSASTVVLRPTRREIHVFNSGTRIGNIKKHGILFPVRMTDP